MTIPLFSSPLFTTIICIVLIYALLSLLVSTITEAINSYFKERGVLLYRTISRLFEDNINVNFGQLLYTHPMISNLKKDNCSLPQYISGQSFSNALIDVISNYGKDYVLHTEEHSVEDRNSNPDIFQRFRAGVGNMKHTELKLVLLNIVDKSLSMTQTRSGNSGIPLMPLDLLQQQIQQWFNDQMERTSGWYKTYLRTRLFWISLVVAILLNADSIFLFQTLYRTPALRAQLEPVAEQLADNYARLQGESSGDALQNAYRAVAATRIKNDSAKTDSVLIQTTNQILHQLHQIDSLTRSSDSVRQGILKSASEQIGQLASLGLPFGWKKNQAPLSWGQHQKDKTSDYFSEHKRFTCWNLLSYLLGILITAVSLSFGAPFWFDLLLKAVNLRRAGSKPSTEQH